MYAQMLVGMVALTGQWWLDARKPKLEEVAAHLINLAWNGLSELETEAADLARRGPARPQVTRQAPGRSRPAVRARPASHHALPCATTKMRRNGRAVPYGAGG